MYETIRNQPATVSARKGLTHIDLSAPSPNAIPPTPTGHGGPSRHGAKDNQKQGTAVSPMRGFSKPDHAIEELRNYLVLMDEYSLHNFLIYDGRTLKETPEYQSFQRAYQYKWGAITSIIFQLEEFLTQNEVKLAIINGPKVYELAKLNLPVLQRGDLQACIANFDQVEASLDSTTEVSKKQMLKIVVKIQALVRMFLSIRRFKRKKLEIKSATIIQSIARRMLQRLQYYVVLNQRLLFHEEQWQIQRQRLREWWVRHSSATPEGSSVDRSRLIISLPSISTLQYLRLEMENFGTLQNVSINQIYMMADPSVEYLYASPFGMSHYQLTYHEKLLALMGISTLPKRFVPVFPEMAEKLSTHLSLSHHLWSSRVALRKLRFHARRSKMAIIVPRSLGWAEKRIANYLNIPFLGPDPTVAETISSRSFLKSFFMESSVNIPIGAHDIFTVEDLMVALTRLIASNLSVIRWIIRLNYDDNHESCVVFEAERMPLILSLRAEQNDLMGEQENMSAWFSRPMQLSVRRRILASLKKEFLQRIRLCRRDIYGSWDVYAKYMRNYGAVVEAEPIETLGHISIVCFIAPTGEVSIVGGAQRYLDECQQTQFYSFPQTLLPEAALQSLSHALCQRLFQQYDVIGYLVLHGTVHWDGLALQPRLWMTDVTFGCSPLQGAMGNASVLLSPPLTAPNQMPLSLAPPLPPGIVHFCGTYHLHIPDFYSLQLDRQFVYIPLATHNPLRSTHDDIFFKLCRMRGIAYDQENKVGTLFFLPDAVITGSISILCIARTRIKAVELASHTLGFVQRNYGMDKEAADSKRYDNLSKILVHLRKVIRLDGNTLATSTIATNMTNTVNPGQSSTQR